MARTVPVRGPVSEPNSFTAPVEYIEVDLPKTPNAKPDHIAPLYAASWAAFGAFVPPVFVPTPSSFDLLLRVALKTTVEIERPNAVPSCVSVWKSAPPTDCSWGRHARAMKSVPVEKEKSAPKTVRIAAGKPNAQYGAAGSMTAKRRFDVAVRRVPMAIGH